MGSSGTPGASNGSTEIGAVGGALCRNITGAFNASLAEVHRGSQYRVLVVEVSRGDDRARALSLTSYEHRDVEDLRECGRCAAVTRILGDNDEVGNPRASCREGGTTQ
jgi:hypothetical protein